MTLQSEILDDDETKLRLRNIGLDLGQWHSLRYSDNTPYKWSKSKARENADDLLLLAQNATDWLPKEGSYTMSFDDSNYIENWQALILEDILGIKISEALLSGSIVVASDNKPQLEIQTSYLLYFFILFKLHVYICSSTCYNGNLLATIDGDVFLICHQDSSGEFADPQAFLEQTQKKPPRWLAEYGL